MALVSVIRRWHIRDGMAIREIARRTGLSRNTVRKYLANKQTDPKYPARKTPSKLDGYERTLTSWLFQEARRHRKQRKTYKQLHERLVTLGFTGSYDRVAAFARQWRTHQQDAGQSSGKRAFIPLKFSPGEAFQFDWSEDWAVIDGTRTKLQIAHFKLCYSRAFYLKAYRQQNHEMLFDAHYEAFVAFHGVPERGIYDNMKTAVDKVARGKERVVNRRFQSMASHYLFELEFCTPGSGWEKGQIEKHVQDSRHWLWQDLPNMDDLESLNQWLAQQCKALWHTLLHPEQTCTIAEVWEQEVPSLMPTPPPFDGFVETSKRVSSTCLIAFERTRYSVPSSFAHRMISLRVYADRLVCVADGKTIAEHQRVFLSNNKKATTKTVYDWRHYLPVLQRKPGALRNGAPFEELPDHFQQLQTLLLKRPGGDREMADVLALVLYHPEALVEQAVLQALTIGRPSKQHVVNCLNRLRDASPPPCIDSPVTLTVEPLADTTHYDTLREADHVN